MRNSMIPSTLATCLAAVAALVPATAVPVVAQTAAAGAVVEWYRFATPEAARVRTIRLVSVPVAVQAPLAGPVHLAVSTAFAQASMEHDDGRSTNLSGPTDTSVRLGVDVAGDRLGVAAIALLPTGSATLSADELEVAGLVAADLLPFRIHSWGTGGAAGAGLTARLDHGSATLQVGASYLVAFEYEPLEANRFGYRPGDQLTGTLAVQQPMGARGRATVRAMVQHFRNDVIDGSSMFAPGNRGQLMASYAAAFGDDASAVVYVGGAYREDGLALHAFARNGPSQTLLLTGGGLRLPAGPAVFVPTVDVRLLRSGDGIGQGYLAGAGAAVELPAGPLVFTPALRGRFGNVTVRQGAESAITGLELALTARFGNTAR
jgi:hypothetical protein